MDPTKTPYESEPTGRIRLPTGDIMDTRRDIGGANQKYRGGSTNSLKPPASPGTPGLIEGLQHLGQQSEYLHGALEDLENILRPALRPEVPTDRASNAGAGQGPSPYSPAVSTVAALDASLRAALRRIENIRNRVDL